MANKDFSTFKSDLKFKLGNTDDLDDYLGSWINEAYTELVTKNRFWGIKRDIEFPQLFKTDNTLATTPGSTYVTVPSDCLYIITMWDQTNDKKLKWISWHDYIAKTGRATTADREKPTKWTRFGSYIHLSPTPDAGYNLTAYYRYVPDEMSATSDTTAIGREWDYLIAKMAEEKGFSALEEPEKAELAGKQALKMLVDMVGMYDKEELDRTDIMAPNFAYLKGFDQT